LSAAKAHKRRSEVRENHTPKVESTTPADAGETSAVAEIAAVVAVAAVGLLPPISSDLPGAAPRSVRCSIACTGRVPS